MVQRVRPGDARPSLPLELALNAFLSGVIASLKSRRSGRPDYVILAAYTAVIAYVACFHEPWRDEVRALSLATESGSLLGIFPRLRNEGHPGLWYVLLYLAYAVFRTSLVLKFVAGAVAVASAAVFLFFSPFPRWQKALFLAGAFPLFEYSVMARNYGIGMLLMFVFCAVYPLRFRRPILVGGVVFLLAQTQAYWLLTAFSISVSLGVEFLWRRKDASTERAPGPRVLAGFALMALGGVLSVLQLRTDSTSTIRRPDEISFTDIGAWMKPLVHPMELFGQGFAVDFPPFFVKSAGIDVRFVVSLLLLGLVLSLLRRPFVFVLFAIAWLSMGAFSSLVYPAALRHQGVVFMVLVASLWLERLGQVGSNAPASRDARPPRWSDAYRGRIDVAQQVALALLFLPQIAHAKQMIALDVRTELTSAKRLGAILQEPELRDAIVIGEPDYVLETLPYYAPNSMYLPREVRFRRFASSTRKNRDPLTLKELLASARDVQRTYHRPVVIAMRWGLNPRGAYLSSGYTFYYTHSMYEDFMAATRHITRLETPKEAPARENYDVYVLNPKGR